jgi:hypothetical protein
MPTVAKKIKYGKANILFVSLGHFISFFKFNLNLNQMIRSIFCLCCHQNVQDRLGII